MGCHAVTPPFSLFPSSPPFIEPHRALRIGIEVEVVVSNLVINTAQVLRSYLWFFL